MCDDDSEQRKQKSIAILKALGIKTMDGLPRIESMDETVLRTKEEVARRTVGLMLISLYAEGLCSGEKRKKHRKWIEGLIRLFDAQDFFTPDERAFLENKDPDMSECIKFSWQYEPFTVMLWALGFLSTKEALAVPAEVCDVTKAVGLMNGYKSYGKFLSDAVLRDKEAILDQADLIYRYNWACVENRISNPMEHKNEWGIVMERHRALNWLINYCEDDWDDVTTDT